MAFVAAGSIPAASAAALERGWSSTTVTHEARAANSEPGNMRILCRAHNQLAAEQAYGRAHIDRAKATNQHPRALTDATERSNDFGGPGLHRAALYVASGRCVR